MSLTTAAVAGRRLSRAERRRRRRLRRRAQATVTPTPAPDLPAPDPPAPDPPATPSDPPGSVVAAPGLRHLLDRATYGATPLSLAAASAQGVEAWLDAQLDPASLPDPVGDRIDAAFPGLFRDPAGARETYHNLRYVIREDLRSWRVFRSAWSSRQLHEVTSDLLHNHLNVPVGVGTETTWTVHGYHHDVVRAHALGSYTDMLLASAEHPAMLLYLDAGSSTGKAPNENYARELLELHSVGVGHHTEDDVRAAALLLTGWRVRSEKVADPCAAYFDPALHHVGPVSILGRTYANGAPDGREEIRRLLRDLASHPATARRLCSRLVQHFVADDPPASLVDRLARTYLDSGTRVAPVLRALLLSADFAGSTGAKVRRPLERHVAVLRLLADEPRAGTDFTQRTITHHLPEHQPLSWPAPNGYPDVAGAWQSTGTSLAMLNTTEKMVRGSVGAVGRTHTDRVLATTATTLDELLAESCDRLLLREPGPRERAAADALLAGTDLGRGPWKIGSGGRYRVAWYLAVLLLNHPDVLAR